MAPLILESARRNIQDIDARQLPRFERFLEDCWYELIDNPTRQDVQQNLDLVRSIADVPIALAAINAEVDYFVTYDADFTDENGTTRKVRQAIPGIILPPVFLRDIMGWTSEELEQIRHRGWDKFDEQSKANTG